MDHHHDAGLDRIIDFETALMDLSNRHFLVLGLGATGRSSARWLLEKGAMVRVADSRTAPPQLAEIRAALGAAQIVTGEFSEQLLENIDTVLVSPGLPLDLPLIQSAEQRGLLVLGDIELFALELQDSKPQLRKPVRVVGITGSNGKSTVTTMIGEMCQRAGLKTVMAGNIGLPVLDALPRKLNEWPDVFVLELSSFQLESTSSLRCDVAVILNISEDHMDRYATLDDYVAAKARLLKNSTVQILNRDDERVLGMVREPRRSILFGMRPAAQIHDWGVERVQGEMWLVEGRRKTMRVAELPLTGAHNVSNALAALAACRALRLPEAPLVAALRAFKGLPHRVQRVATVSGVSFYDDSKGTNVGATVAALKGMEQKVVLIVGGDGKGQDFSPLREAVRDHARAVVLIGRDREQIARELHDLDVPMVRAATMSEAVTLGFGRAKSGDAVLLSPACASFDMFRDYAHRAQVFVAAVEALHQRIREQSAIDGGH